MSFQNTSNKGVKVMSTERKETVGFAARVVLKGLSD